MSTRPETVEEFLARGQKIQHIPRGAQAELGWKPQDYSPNSPAARQRSFDQMREAKALKARIDREEREARKAAKVVDPLRVKTLRRRKEARPSRAVVKVRKVTPAKPRPFAAEGTAKRRVLDAMDDGWISVKELSDATGVSPSNVREYLRLLRARRMVEAIGTSMDRRFRKLDGKPRPPAPKPPEGPRGLAAGILEAIKAGARTVDDIQKATGQKRACISVRLGRLKFEGYVDTRGRARNARWWVKR